LRSAAACPVAAVVGNDADSVISHLEWVACVYHRPVLLGSLDDEPAGQYEETRWSGGFIGAIALVGLIGVMVLAFLLSRGGLPAPS
jgi:hypothetical protein